MMRIAEALDAFRPHRGDAIVVPGRGGRYWVDQTDQPDLDVPLGDPAMGGHAGFALGLALARPERKLVLFDSEGDIQMSLGMLATIAEQAPANFYHFLLDNECYATTGGQPVPNAEEHRLRQAGARRRLSARACLCRARRFRERAAGDPAAARPGLRVAEGLPEVENRADRQPPALADAHAATRSSPICAARSGCRRHDAAVAEHPDTQARPGHTPGISMRGNVIEVVIGAVVLVVAALFLVFAYRTSQSRTASGGYEVTADFSRVDGIHQGSDVRISGIKVGTVVADELDPKTYLATIRMNIDPAVQLPEDTVAQVTSSGLLGDKYMSLAPGGSDTMIPPGGKIQYTQSSISLENLIGQMMFSHPGRQERAGEGAAPPPGPEAPPQAAAPAPLAPAPAAPR